MNRFLNSWCVVLSLLWLIAAGCDGMTAPKQSAPVTITVDRMIEQTDLVVVRAHVVFPGERKVHLWQKTDSETAAVQPDPKTGMAECEVLLVADVIKTGEASHARWLHAIRNRTGQAGGPATHVIPGDSKLADLLQIQIQSGDYQFGQEIEVAIFHDEPLRLRIE